MKTCPKCKTEKDEAEFYPNKSKWTGRSSWCKECNRAYGRERYRRPEVNERMRAYHREDERKKRRDPIKNAVILQKLKDKRIRDPEWKDRVNAQQKERRRKDIGGILWREAGVRARGRGLPFTITREWTVSLCAYGHCEYCMAELVVGGGGASKNSPSLDRFEQSAGYTPENTVLACWACNSLKRDATAAQLRRLADDMDRLAAQKAELAALDA